MFAAQWSSFSPAFLGKSPPERRGASPKADVGRGVSPRGTFLSPARQGKECSPGPAALLRDTQDGALVADIGRIPRIWGRHAPKLCQAGRVLGTNGRSSLSKSKLCGWTKRRRTGFHPFSFLKLLSDICGWQLHLSVIQPCRITQTLCSVCSFFTSSTESPTNFAIFSRLIVPSANIFLATSNMPSLNV